MGEVFGPGWQMYYVQRSGVLIVSWVVETSQHKQPILPPHSTGQPDWRIARHDKKISVSNLPDLDLARQLNSEADIAAYITMVIEEGDAAELAHALGVAARARGMTEIAHAAGLTRKALYRALRPGAHPRFDTINRVCSALGVRLIAQPLR